MAKPPAEIRSLARTHTRTAINTLKAIMGSPRAPAAARVAAAAHLLDRGWGKPHATSEVSIRRILASQLSDDELADIASGSGDGVDPAPVDPAQLN
jgi:hypothetical protein